MSEDGITRGSSRRTFIKSVPLISSVGLAGCTAGSGGDGEEIEFGDIEFAINYGPESGFTSYARGLAPIMEDLLPGNPSITVNNRPGGGGAVALNYLNQAEPDGETWAWGNIPSFNQTEMIRDTDYSMTDFRALGTVDVFLRILVVGKQFAEENDIPVGGFEEFREYTKNVEPALFATLGAGDGSHVSGAVMAAAHDFEAEFAHYSEGGRLAVLNGEVDAHVSAPGSIRDYIIEGDFIPIYICGTRDQVNAAAPWLTEEMKTEYELDLEPAGDVVNGHRIVITNADVPEERLQILRDAFSEACQSDEFMEWGETSNRPINCMTGEEEDTYMRETAYETSEPYIDIVADALGQ